MSWRIALGLLVPAALAAVGAWLVSMSGDASSAESLGVTFTLYGLYVAGFLVALVASRVISRDHLIGVALAVVLAVTIPSAVGLYGAVIGVYLLFALGVPALGALAASILTRTRPQVPGF